MRERTDAELVKIAAEKVMGWMVRVTGMGNTVADTGEGAFHINGTLRILKSWNPLESIADAFMLADELIAAGRTMMLTCIGSETSALFAVSGKGSVFQASAPTCSRAITLAAIAAVEREGR